MEKLFFSKALRSDLILLGTADKHDFFKKKNDIFVFTQTFFFFNGGLPRFLATIVNVPNIAGALSNLEIFGTIANLATNQDKTLHQKSNCTDVYVYISIYI